MSPRPTLEHTAGFPVVFAVALLIPAAGVLAQHSDVSISPGTILQVRQLSPLSTSFNRKGDLVSAKIVEPPAMQGGFLEGEISEIRDGDKGARIEFEFHTLYLAGQSIAVAAMPVAVTNSRGVPGVDESGAAIDGAGQGSGGKLSKSLRMSRSNGFRLTAKTAHLILGVGAAWTVQIAPRKR